MTDNKKIKKQNIKFFNFWAKYYEKEPTSIWLKHIQRKIIGQIPIKHNSSVLDVGCGTGSGLQIFLKKGLKNLAGVDLSSEMIKQARKKLDKKIILKIGSVEEIPFSNDKFDFVITTEAFHHFPDPSKAIREMARVLKKGGLLYLTDLNFYSNFIHWLFKKLEPGHVGFYSKDEFKQFFENAGLSVIEQKRIELFVILTVGEKQ